MVTNSIMPRLLVFSHRVLTKFSVHSKVQRRPWLQQNTRSVSSHPEYTFQRLKVDDRDEIIDFISRYYRDEPLNVAVNLLETPDSRSKELEDHSVSSLHHGISLGIVSENDGLVAVMLSEIVRRKNPVYINKSQHCPDPKFRRILQVLEHLERQACMWDALPESCQTLFYMSVGAAHTEWRGKGLCRMLCEESERLARTLGFGAIRMDCTSAFTTLVAERLDYTKLCGVKYKDLPFAPQPDPPHLEASIFIKEFQD